MSCLYSASPFKEKTTGNDILQGVSADLIKKMRDAAQAPEPLASLSTAIFSQLRKVSNLSRSLEILRVIQGLAMEGTSDGSRVLAAFLDVNTPGARLIPQIKNFHSSRRRRLAMLSLSDKRGSYEKGWLHRLDLLGDRCSQILKERNISVSEESSRPGYEAPWPTLRACLHGLLMDIAINKPLSQENRDVLIGLLKLETDSRQDRVSNLAGIVNPFNIPQVARLLPMLNTIDGDIRDLRQLVVWIAEGKDKVVFNKQISRGLEVMTANEFSILLGADEKAADLSPLLGLLRHQNDTPVSLPDLAAGMARIMALNSRMMEAGICDQDMDSLSAASLIQSHRAGKEVWIPLEFGLSADVHQLLDAQPQGNLAPWLPLSGVRVQGDQLCIPLSDGDQLSNILDGGLPSLEYVKMLLAQCDEGPAGKDESLDLENSGNPEDEKLKDDNKADDSTAAVTQLVMQNIQSLSVLLGFLHNPKITAIPGLVAKVANRTRNPRIIETIATDRTLHSGFANRDVPLACLVSPCNVPVKTLVKFIHVKFISKVDLRRMAKDKTGMRREVVNEIEKYLDSLD